MSDPAAGKADGAPADAAGREVPPPPRVRLRFPRAARLTRATEFRRVKEQGQSWGGRFLVLGVLVRATADNPHATARIGFVTSRRVGAGAVDRNRVRRRLREILRRHRAELRTGCWIVLIARHTAARASSEELAADWLRLARRAAILVARGS